MTIDWPLTALFAVISAAIWFLWRTAMLDFERRQRMRQERRDIVAMRLATEHKLEIKT